MANLPHEYLLPDGKTFNPAFAPLTRPKLHDPFAQPLLRAALEVKMELIGVCFAGFSFFSLVFIILRRLIFGDPVAGWASTVCVIIFVGGVQLLSVGVLGQYIAKIYSEVKRRPIYIVSDTNMGDDQTREPSPRSSG